MKINQNIDVTHINTQALEMASEILCVLRANGYIVPSASEKSQFASAHFLYFLLGDGEESPEYRLAALRSSVDNCVSLIEGAGQVKNNNKLSDAEYAEMIRTIQDIRSCVESVVEGAKERLQSLMLLDNLATNHQTAGEEWDVVMDGSAFGKDTPGLSDMIAVTAAPKRKVK